MEGLHPFGLQKLVLYQDKFNVNTDFVEKDENGNIIGMWADYFQSPIEPKETQSENRPDSDYGIITCSGHTQKLKIGGGYKTLTCSFFTPSGKPAAHTAAEWHFSIDGLSADDSIIQSQTDTPNSVRIKCPNDQNYIGKILTVSVQDDSGTCSCELQLELISL